jgi:hypothetical protein
MSGYMKSLLAELFPRWLKQDVVQHRLGDPPRRAAMQNPPEETRTTFGQRASYRAPAGGGAARRSRGRK